MNHCKEPFEWNNNKDSSCDGLDSTPTAVYQNIPAEMPGLMVDRLERDTSYDPPAQPSGTEIDWTQMADKEATNTELDLVDHLPP